MKIKDYLKTHQQWCKGDLQTAQGRVCLLGAACKCYTDYNARKKVEDQLTKIISKLSNGSFTDIASFNDDPKTSFKDIQKVINKANV